MSRLFGLLLVCLMMFVLSACGGAAPAPAPAPTAAPAAPAAPKAEAPKAEAPKAAAPAGKAASQPAQPTSPAIPTKAAAPFVTITAQPRVLVEPTAGAAAKATQAPAAAKATVAPAAGGGAAGGPTAPGVATGRRSEVKLDFIKQLSTAEEVDDIRLTLTRVPGILDIAGNETAITVGYDAGLILPNQIARRLAEMGHEVKPPA